MTEKSIIIIGAGLAGLSTGCHKPGQSIYELYRELGTAQSNRFLDMTSCCRFIDEASGRNVEITPDLELPAKKLKALSPADSRFIDDLIAGASAMQGTDIGDMGMSQPHELLGFLDNLKQMWKMRRFFKYFMGKYSRAGTEKKGALSALKIALGFARGARIVRKLAIATSPWPQTCPEVAKKELAIDAAAKKFYLTCLDAALLLPTFRSHMDFFIRQKLSLECKQYLPADYAFYNGKD